MTEKDKNRAEIEAGLKALPFDEKGNKYIADAVHAAVPVVDLWCDGQKREAIEAYLQLSEPNKYHFIMGMPDLEHSEFLILLGAKI